MSLDKILKKIIDEAQVEADRIILESQSKADVIKENARREASEMGKALEKEAERQGRLESSRIITQARLEGKLEILSLKKELIEEVLNLAFQKSAFKKRRLKRTIILKEGEKEEPYDEARFKEELRSRLENEIIEALKI
jgi:vacuolar-type H+-ATPase subunit H